MQMGSLRPFLINVRDIVKSEVLSFFCPFHEVDSFEKRLNASFIVLVPKKANGDNGLKVPNKKVIHLMYTYCIQAAH